MQVTMAAIAIAPSARPTTVSVSMRRGVASAAPSAPVRWRCFTTVSPFLVMARQAQDRYTP